MKNLKLKIVLPIAAVLLTVFIYGNGKQSQASISNPLAGLQKIKYVMDVVRELHVDTMDIDKLVDGAIKGMLEELDPHSVYISTSEMQEVNEDISGEFEGIGIYFEIRDKRLTVVSAIPGTPSDRLGLSPGDVITEIEGESAYGIINSEVQKKLKGPSGSEVNITIGRPGLSEPLNYTIVRAKIPILSVESAFLLEDGVGYVRLNRFMSTSEKEVLAAIEDLKSQGMKKLIFDLRNNPGGLLDQAHRVADLFLPGGKVIVSTEWRNSEYNEVYKSTNATTIDDVPLIILINQGSASASEIVSGAVQDWDRGLVAGRTSFGKGLVQRSIPLQDESAVRVTAAHYYTPSHRLIQRPFDKGLLDYYRDGWDDIDPNMDADSTMDKPVFYTAAGRKVYGGGGITPDVLIRSSRLTAYTSKLRTSRAFLDFANTNYITGELHDDLKQMDFNRYLQTWEADKNLLELFVSQSEEDVEFVQEDWEKDLRWIKGYLKREIARVIWGRTQALRIDLQNDPALREAQLLFDEASRIQKLHAGK
jgi:carboxyl-terminal processing protease